MNLSTVRAQPFRLYHKRREKKHLQSIGLFIKYWYWLILIGGMTIVYYLVNYRWLPTASKVSYFNLAQPLTWSLLALMAYMGWRFGLRDRPSFTKRLLIIASLMGATQAALYAIVGLWYGFGRSPYGSLLLVLGNILYVLPMLVSVEISRAYLLATFSKGSMIVALLVSSYIFWFLSIPVAKYSAVTDLSSLLRISCETFLPVGAENLLASFLALIGGPLASFAYRSTLQTLMWFSPILPNLHWALPAFIGTMVPIIGMLVLRNHVLVKPTDTEGNRSEAFRTSTLWVLAGAAVVTLLWFNTGIFGVQPTVVSGVSMEPTMMAGDVVITREVDAEAVEVGDIIRFRRGDVYILHRVVEIKKDSGEILFITRGDANYALDPPVRAYQLKGKVVLTVPKIGWVRIAARQLVEWTP